MKKKLLLIALPALMVMSACSRINYPVEQKGQPAFTEDTLAHEEQFGEAKMAKSQAPRKMGIVDEKTHFKVGYQIHFDDKGDADDSNDVMSIRFVAAIDSDSYTKMLWSRGLTGPSGTEKLTFSSNSSAPGYPELVSTVVYPSLSSGGTDEMVAGGEDPTNPYKDFAGFIVYSITDIPYEDYKDYYLGVSLTLTPAAGEDIHTDFYAVKVKKYNDISSDYTFSFPYNKTGFFLAGDFGGDYGTKDPDGTPRKSKVASFTAELGIDDNFVVVQKTASMFKVWSGSCLQDADEDVSDNDGIILIHDDTKYVFYLNDKNEVSFDKYGEGVNWYVRGPATTGNWDSVAENSIYRMVSDPDNNAIILGVHLEKGDFKITHGSDWDNPKGWSDTDGGGANDGTHIKPGASDNNIYCNVAGNYNIYLNSEWHLYFEFIS